MKKSIILAIIALIGMTQNSQAQSWKDIFNKDNIEKVVNAVTGKSTTVDVTGTWIFTGSAIELKSDNMLTNLGGTAAAGVAEEKLNEQLKKVGITPGKLTFTFNADSTFTTKLNKKTLKGTYSYKADEESLQLKFAKLIPMNAKVNCTSSNMDLLFNADKLMSLLTTLSSKSKNTTLKTLGSLAENYDGMMLGFSMKKQQQE